MLAALSYPPIPLFHVGPLRLSLHGVMAAVGFLAGGWLAARHLTRRGFDGERYQSVLSWAIVGALLGARYFTTPAALVDGVPLGTALNPFSGNFSIMGGFAGGIIAGWWRMGKVELARLPTFDSSAFGLALGTVVGRIGDLIIVEHLGRATNLAWGYGVKPGYDLAPQHDRLECVAGEALSNGLCPIPQSAADMGLGVAGEPGIYHHVAMYDLLGAAVLLAVLYQVQKRFRLHYGQLISVWVVWYGFQRFLLDFLRIGSGDRQLGDFTWNQLSGLAAGLLGVALFVWFGRKTPVVTDEADSGMSGRISEVVRQG